ncbi:MAG: permease [Desulfuromonas sp.]|nr:MAG: permease [Desulfuromonas sp.]
MLKTGLIYLVAIAIIYLFCFKEDAEKGRQSLTAARQTLLRMFPLLLSIFALIGLFQEFVPPELVHSWLGADNHFLSLLNGGLAGAVAIGPPVAAFPIAGSFIESGAWPPAAAAFIVSWVSVGVVTLPVEAHVFGWRFTLWRNAVTFVSALLIGLLIGGLI